MKVFKVHALSMCFPKHANMGQQRNKNLNYVSIKVVQSNVQKCITWPKKSRKGRQKWNKTCMDFEIFPRKLNTLVNIK
jgi:hypothetical protein